jgi:hypothetical protein
MAIDLDAVKRRIHERAEKVKREGERVVVTLAPRDVAWECWVEWSGPDGLAEATGYAGSLQDLENHVMLQITATRREEETT